MTAISARDAECALRFVAVAGEMGGDQPFTPPVLVELGKLVAGDCVTYCEQDRVRKRIRLDIERPGDDSSDPPVSYWDIAHEHPVCRRHNIGDFSASKLSDFVTLQELKKSHVYAVWFRPFGIDHELCVAIPSPPWHTKTFLFDRHPGRDFTERDRLVLDLLQPHLGQLWRAAQTRRRLRAALTALEWVGERHARGVILLAPGGRVEVVSPAARRLVREYFGSSCEKGLPPGLADWLESGAPTMSRQLDNRRLTIDREGEALLLEEAHDELGLTAREQQILSWVARGQTNPEIAETLWIAPSTVRKHLENVFAKLGVHTRTAAITRFLGVLEGTLSEDRSDSVDG